jgi:hypothetical protein
MPSLLSRYQQHDAASPSAIVLPLILLVSALLAYLATPAKHALLTSAVAWLSICTYSTLKLGARSLVDALPPQRLAWAAGGLWGLAQMCERAVDGRGIWWAKVNTITILRRSSD